MVAVFLITKPVVEAEAELVTLSTLKRHWTRPRLWRPCCRPAAQVHLSQVDHQAWSSHLGGSSDQRRQAWFSNSPQQSSSGAGPVQERRGNFLVHVGLRLLGCKVQGQLIGDSAQSIIRGHTGQGGIVSARLLPSSWPLCC